IYYLRITSKKHSFHLYFASEWNSMFPCRIGSPECASHSVRDQPHISQESVAPLSHLTSLTRNSNMRVLVTGGTGHIGSYIIPELIAAGHEVTGLARSDKAAAAVSALGAKARRGDISDLDGLKAAAAESDGVIHVAHRQDLLPTGGIDAVAAAERQIMLAYGEALAGTGKPLIAAGSIGSPGWETLGRPAT